MSYLWSDWKWLDFSSIGCQEWPNSDWSSHHLNWSLWTTFSCPFQPLHWIQDSKNLLKKNLSQFNLPEIHKQVYKDIRSLYFIEATRGLHKDIRVDACFGFASEWWKTRLTTNIHNTHHIPYIGNEYTESECIVFQSMIHVFYNPFHSQ